MDEIQKVVLKSTEDIVLNREPSRCRLLYVIGQLGLGGAERQLYYLISHLESSRYYPCVVVWNYDPDEKYYRAIDALQLPIYGLPAQWSPLAKLQALRKLAQRLAPEVIHSYVFFTNFAAAYAARRTGALAVGSLRSDIVRSLQSGGALRGVLNSRWPRCHISNSAVCAETARRHSSFFVPRQYIVVRNGLDLASFRTPENAFEIRGYVASVGSLLPVKRWDRLVKAVQKVLSVGIKDVRFRLAGDGPLRQTLRQLAEGLGVSHAIEFLGAVHDIPVFLQGAKFLVHTSDSEGCPNAVMEAMAAGRAVIATDVGDIPHLVQDGKTGFVVQRDDSEALLDRIVTLLTDADLCRQMGSKAREKAEQEFDLSAFVARTLDAYRTAGWKDASHPQRINKA